MAVWTILTMKKRYPLAREFETYYYYRLSLLSCRFIPVGRLLDGSGDFRFARDSETANGLGNSDPPRS